jgi:penicillin amidase
MAEVIGATAVARDRQARLLKYRGPADDGELASYHPQGRRIMTAFASGINAYIRDRASRLPVEIVLTGIRPDPWTIETLLLRQNTFGDATSELQLARSVAQLGAAEANKRRNPDPWEELIVPEGLDVSAVDDAVVAGTAAGGGRGSLRPEILPAYRSLIIAAPRQRRILRDPGATIGLSAARCRRPASLVANDPHREVGNPSLRYIAPERAGWNVIGASEPPFSASRSHNEASSAGADDIGTDQHDVTSRK